MISLRYRNDIKLLLVASQKLEKEHKVRRYDSWLVLSTTTSERSFILWFISLMYRLAVTLTVLLEIFSATTGLDRCPSPESATAHRVSSFSTAEQALFGRCHQAEDCILGSTTSFFTGKESLAKVELPRTNTQGENTEKSSTGSFRTRPTFCPWRSELTIKKLSCCQTKQAFETAIYFTNVPLMRRGREYLYNFTHM
jgi:hypothetical protein